MRGVVSDGEGRRDRRKIQEIGDDYLLRAIKDRSGSDHLGEIKIIRHHGQT